MSSLKIRLADNPKVYKAFFNFPWKVYKDDPNWVPPLISMRKDVIDKKRNPAWEYMEGDYFVAYRDDEPVGTIAAFVNHRHNEFHGENTGWFGAFEVFEDAEAAQLLLTTAIDWVRNKGCDRILGPQTFTTHEDVGLLVNGFEPPVLLMPYQAPYYQGFIESAGFEKQMDNYSFYFDWDMLRATGLYERLDRIAQYAAKRRGIEIRSIDSKNLKRDFALFKEIYNKAWSENWGFVPLTEKELDMLIEGLGMIFDPELACFAMVDGEPIGFLITIPDFNQAIKYASPKPGEPEPLTLIKLLWHWKLRPKINRARVPLMGVIGEYRNKGADLLMYKHVLDALQRKPFKSIDCGWILETNADMVGVMEGMGFEIYKTHRIYQKLF